MSTSTSPTNTRRKPAPPRTPTEEPPPLPDPPQTEEESRQQERPFDIEEDEDEEEANTAALIDPATIPPSRSTLFSTLIPSTIPSDDQTPRPLRSRSDWDTPDSYPPFQQPSTRNQDSSRTHQRTLTPTIKVHSEAPPQETLSQEEIQAFKILLSKPSRAND